MVEVPASERLAGLDALRGLAILLVVASHLQPALGLSGRAAGLLFAPAWGVGVDLFFVISGLLVFESLRRLRSSRVAREAIVAFYVRRVFRIMPLTLCMTAALAAGLVVPRSMILDADIAAALTFTGNFHWARCFGAAAGCGSPFAFAPFWSIATEMQFYLLAPILVYALPRPTLMALVGCILLTGMLVARPWGGMMWTFRVDGLAVGLMLGASLDTRLFEKAASRLWSVGIAEAALWMTVAALLVAIAPPAAQGAATVAVALICGVLVLGTILNERQSQSPPTMVLTAIGRWSFALYLVHLPIVWLAGWMFTSTVGAVTAGCGGVAVAIVLAWVLTTFVGDPIYEHGRARTRSRGVKVIRRQGDEIG